MPKWDDTLTMLKDLTDAKGVPGNEKEIRDVVTNYISPYADEVYTDNLGSLVAKRTGQEDGPKVMMAGHLDEIGFMVTRIDDNGFLYFQNLGGWWTQVMLAQRVTIMTEKGDLTGVIGSKPPHILSAEQRKQAVDMKEMFIDIGASSKEEAEGFGVKPGDSIVPYFEFTQMPNEKMLLAKAWDNRIGCAITIEAMRRLKEEGHPNVLYGVNTVQEEVQRRGAKTSAHMIDPDIGFAVDVGIAGDTPGVSDKDAASKMGEGPQIILYDASMISHKGLRDYVIDTAEKNDIPYQFDVIGGGATDAGSIHLTGNGVPSLVITVATRYIHSHAAMLHRDDFENAVNLFVEIIKGLDADKVKEITFD
ncbi:M42 family metallopeptidase [Pontibacillus marinus]|uniref:Peptidase M28 n=1 Tax=Pontibacillus marinus BH030004 = DSM 16465 TaxID=1385511 RepID=A0A0A5HHM2_9BACI|nr:M42 family metallopeptidase [Pontibacillus marinus]KGX83147.1 peptidase M28 [Pontibacillus marinus BH030004 = DSM 16465]